MIQIVLYEMFCSATKGRRETDPYGDIEMVVYCRGRPCVCPGCGAIFVGDGKMIGEMVGRDAHATKRNIFPEEGVVINDYDLRLIYTIS